MLKLIADVNNEQILGVHILGECASELVHLCQLALLEKTPVRRFVEQIFNLPTLAETDQVAASSIQGQKLSKGFDHVSAVQAVCSYRRCSRARLCSDCRLIMWRPMILWV